MYLEHFRLAMLATYTFRTWESKTVAIRHLWITLFGTPLYSDHGSCKLMADLYASDMMRIEKTHTISMRPQANVGLWRGLIKTWSPCLNLTVNQNKTFTFSKWWWIIAFLLIKATLARNQVKINLHSDQQYSTNASSIRRPLLEDGRADVDSYVMNRLGKLHKCHEITRTNLKVATRYHLRGLGWMILKHII